MALKLKDESIVDEWTTLVERASGQAQFVYGETEKRLGASEIPGGCQWSREEVKAGGWFSNVKRDFLVVTIEQFKDYKALIGVRDFGTHLHATEFIVAEPGFLKRAIAQKLAEDPLALSRGTNILEHQDLVAWRTVVHHCVLDSVKTLMEKIGQDPTKLSTKSKGFLEVW